MHRYRHYQVHRYRSARYVRGSYRVARRSYRGARHLPPPLLIVVGMLGVITVVTVLILLMLILMVMLPVLIAGLAVRAVTRQIPPRTRPVPPVRPIPPVAALRRAVAPRPVMDPWLAARAGFAKLRQSYAEYECDPLAVLRLPALADVTVPSTARFIEAFAEAQALDTDAPPPPPHRARYIAAVEHAGRAWTAAREAAERIQASHLPEKERATVERVVRLLTTARESDNDAERLVAYAKARNELIRLEKTGHFRLPRPAKAMLDTASRGQLPA
jgi:hypothetical protein